MTNKQDNGSSYSFDFGAAVPEPASWGLLIVGFGLIGSMLRARRTQRA